MGLCSHDCVNSIGSYSCSCPNGFELSGNNCVGELSTPCYLKMLLRSDKMETINRADHLFFLASIRFGSRLLNKLCNMCEHCQMYMNGCILVYVCKQIQMNAPQETLADQSKSASMVSVTTSASQRRLRQPSAVSTLLLLIGQGVRRLLSAIYMYLSDNARPAIIHIVF